MRFGRKRGEQPARDAEPTDAAETDERAGADVAQETSKTSGPWDASEVDLDGEDPARVDLGGLVVKARPGLELRLQVDEATQQVAAVLFLGRDGALELRPFAAPRSGGIWGDIRKQIAAETARRGGTATEAKGPYGTELRVMMPAKTQDGKSVTQPSRVLGIEGPRWLLRATLMGRPAVEPDSQTEVESALHDVVVVRGSGPMAPGEPLPLAVPSGSRPVPGEGAEGAG